MDSWKGPRDNQRGRRNRVRSEGEVAGKEKENTGKGADSQIEEKKK